MTRSNNHFKAGLFILISFAIALGIFFGITGSTLFSGPTKTYTVVFDLHEDVSGLTDGTEVRLGGTRIGEVDDVEVTELDGRPVVKATLSLPARYKLTKEAIVAVQGAITGTVNLNITSLGNGELAGPDDLLDGRPSGLSVVFDMLTGLGGDARLTLNDIRPRLNGILDDTRPRVNDTLDQFKATAVTADETIRHIKSKIDPAYAKYEGVADNASGAMANLNDVLGDTKGDIRSTMASLASATGTLKEKLPAVMDKVANALDGFRGTLDKTAAVLEEVNATAANAKDLTGNIRSILAGNRSRLDEIIKSANVASQNLAAASGEIRRSPWRLLYKPNDNEANNQNLYDAARQFAEASRKLQDSSQALRDTLQDPGAKEADIRKILERLDGDFTNYKKVESALWERVR